MKLGLSLFLIFQMWYIAVAQEIVPLPHQRAEGVAWTLPQREYLSEIWNKNAVTNVSEPSMEVFRPQWPNGTAVIIAPGGALYALSIESEGRHVARWLNEKGITAFVLRYRLVPTGTDGVREIGDDNDPDPEKMFRKVADVLPFSVADGRSAVRYVRAHARNFSVDTDKIGLMGFSAGGAVTMGAAYSYEGEGRPDFIVPIYPWTDAMPVGQTPNDAPPMLVICATDDPLGLANGSIELYTSWLRAGKSAGLHLYAKGGHGFGMEEQGLPSDTWIERFYDWAVAEGLTAPYIPQEK